jgi:hypothetical protein
MSFRVSVWDRRRRLGCALMFVGVVVLLLLLLAWLIAVSEWILYVEGSERVDYWADIILLVVSILGSVLHPPA